MFKTILLGAGILAALAQSPVRAQTPDTPARAISDSLTAARVVAVARDRAPQIRAAQYEALAARSRLSGARALSQQNPTIEALATAQDRFDRRTEWELTLPFGIGLERAGRVGVARAELGRRQDLLADARGRAIGAALGAYYRALHAGRRVELARERQALAANLLRIAGERQRAGEVARLEVLLAEIEEARAGSELLAEEERLARERLALAAALGLPGGDGLVVAGALEDRSIVAPARARDTRGPRADVRAAEQEVRAARSALSLSRTDLLPDLAFRMSYEHEAGEALVRSGLAVTVPLFQHGQESRGLARARELQAQADLQRIRNTAAAESEALSRAYEAAAAAADQLAGRAMPRVEESEAMVRESYRAGKIDLPSFLVIRRDLLDARREYLDRLLYAAITAVDLAVATGAFQ